MCACVCVCVSVCVCVFVPAVLVQERPASPLALVREATWAAFLKARRQKADTFGRPTEQDERERRGSISGPGFCRKEIVFEEVKRGGAVGSGPDTWPRPRRRCWAPRTGAGGWYYPSGRIPGGHGGQCDGRGNGEVCRQCEYVPTRRYLVPAENG